MLWWRLAIFKVGRRVLLKDGQYFFPWDRGAKAKTKKKYGIYMYTYGSESILFYFVAMQNVFFLFFCLLWTRKRCKFTDYKNGFGEFGTLL